jgi:hypothetical protein
VAFLRYLPAQSAICVIIHATARATAYRVAIGCRRLAENHRTFAPLRLCESHEAQTSILLRLLRELLTVFQTDTAGSA